MKQFSQQFYKKAETVKLRAAERRELRERLVTYMEYHPLPVKEQMKATQKRRTAPVGPSLAEPFTTVSIPFARLMRVGVAAVALVLIAVPVLAERAVPGDTLYAVKVRFNEELRSTLTFNSYQKVEWETERINRRIAEARLLASEGRLTEAVEAEVADAVRTHTESVQREIEVLRSKNVDEAAIASIALDTTLEIQSTSLKGEREEVGIATVSATTATPRPVSLIATAIDESRDRARESAATTTLPAYDKLMARIEQNTTRIYELSNALSQVAPADELAEINRRIEDIDRAIQEAVAEVEVDEVSARQALVEVLQRTQRLIVYITELEVTETVDIETLLPVVLTSEEKRSEMERSKQLLVEKLDRIAVMQDEVTESAILEKVSVASTSIAVLQDKMASTTVDTFAAFVLAAKEAHALADDVISLLEAELSPEILDEVAATSSTSSATSSPDIPSDVAPTSTAATSSASATTSTPAATSSKDATTEEEGGVSNEPTTESSDDANTTTPAVSTSGRATTATGTVDSN